MLTHLITPVRVLLLSAALAVAAQALDVRAAPEPTQATTRATARTRADAPSSDRDEFPYEGILIVVGIVGIVIGIAWVASRLGDNH